MNNRKGLVIGLLAALLLAACAKEPTTEEYLVRAEVLSKSGDHVAALIELKNAARQEPFNMRVRRAMTYTQLELGQGADAEKEARRALEMGMEDGEAALLLARALIMQGKFEELLAEDNEFNIAPDPAAQSEIMAWRAVALLELGEADLAGTTLEVALDLDGDSPIALAASGSLQARLGNTDEAKRLVEEALKADPMSAEALALKGDLLANEGDLDGARQAYTAAVKSRGYPSLVNARRAMVSLRLGDLKLAQSDIGLLRRAGLGKLAYVHQVRGLLLYEKGDYAGAATELSKGLEAVPDSVPMKVYLAMTLLADDRTEQADVILKQLYQQVPDSWAVAQLQAELAVQRADVAGARETLNAIRQRAGEENATVVGMLGALALIEGDPGTAISYFEKVLEIEPGNELASEALIEAQTMRGDFIERDLAAIAGELDESQYSQVLLSSASALRQGRREDALELAQALRKQFPDKTDPLKIFATVELTDGDFESARKTMEEILRLEPYDPSTTLNLAKVYNVMGDGELSRDLLGKYLEQHPEDSLARAILSGVVVETSDAAAAISELDEMLVQDPDNHSVRARLVKLNFEAGEFEKVVVLTEGLKKDWIVVQPTLIELRGKAFAHLGETAMVESTWEEWYRAAPNSSLANFYHGDGLVSQGQLKEASAAYDRSVELNNRYLPARLAQVRINALLGDTAGARKLMDSLEADIQGDVPEVLRMDGWLAVREQDFEAAEAAYVRALGIEPDVESALVLTIVLNTLGKQDEAAAELARWREVFPDNLKLLAMQAESYINTDPARAVELYGEMLEIAPNSILALNNLAWLTRDSNPEQALAYAARAHELLPESAVVMDTYGKLLAASGELSDASEMLSGAVKAEPQNMQYRLNYARVLLQQGRVSFARTELDRVISEAAPELAAEARSLLLSIPEG